MLSPLALRESFWRSPERSAAAEHQDSDSSTALAECDSGRLGAATLGSRFAPVVRSRQKWMSLIPWTVALRYGVGQVPPREGHSKRGGSLTYHACDDSGARIVPRPVRQRRPPLTPPRKEGPVLMHALVGPRVNAGTTDGPGVTRHRKVVMFIHAPRHVPSKLSQGTRGLRKYGFTDLPPSLPLFASTPFTRNRESSYRAGISPTWPWDEWELGTERWERPP